MSRPVCGAGLGRRPPLSSCVACGRLLACARDRHPRARAALRLRCRLLARALRGPRRPLRFDTARRAWRREFSAGRAVLRASRARRPARQLSIPGLGREGDDPQ